MSSATLKNWRVSPVNQWAFQNIRQLIPSAVIRSHRDTTPLPESSLDGLGTKDLNTFLSESHTDNLVILHHGKKVWQWHAPYNDITKPHIVFSVSKSITAMLAGVLASEGILDVAKPLLHYLPAVKGSAYEDASLQQLLDMQVALDFEESYLDSTGEFRRYRDATGWNPVDQTNPGPDLENFLYGLKKSALNHGEVFEYKSPNSDLLGLIIERAAGTPYAECLSSLIWQPMGAETDGYVTVDRNLLARGAGGICITVDDLARFGQLVLNKGSANGRQIIPESWIDDTSTAGSRSAWQKGEFISLLPQGCYRNQWYQVGDADQSILALGIHGQWLYINPAAEIVIAKTGSQPEPLDDRLDTQTLKLFSELCESIAR